MAFGDSYSRQDTGGGNAAKWRNHAEIAAKLRAYLGLERCISVYQIKFEVWASVVWVYVPGFRPRFVSLVAIA
jgi:hypothetical protein